LPAKEVERHVKSFLKYKIFGIKPQIQLDKDRLNEKHTIRINENLEHLKRRRIQLY
jgi:hypothetical protein